MDFGGLWLGLPKKKPLHKEEPIEDFGTFNNFNTKHIKARTKQSKLSHKPHFKPYDTKSYNKPSLNPISSSITNEHLEFDDNICNLEYYDMPNIINKDNILEFSKDLNKPQPIPMAVTPYHTYMDAIQDPYTYLNHSINKLDAVRIQDYRIPQKICTVSDRLLHISNYTASKEELDEAKKLAHDQPNKQIKLSYIRDIHKQLHTKMTKLIHIEHKHIFAKFQSDRTIIPNYEFKIDLRLLVRK